MNSTVETVELEDIRLPVPALMPVEDNAADASSQAHREFSLPPTDRGKDAWLFLAACWAVEALVWGRILLSAFLS